MIIAILIAYIGTVMAVAPAGCPGIRNELPVLDLTP